MDLFQSLFKKLGIGDVIQDLVHPCLGDWFEKRGVPVELIATALAKVSQNNLGALSHPFQQVIMVEAVLWPPSRKWQKSSA
jgi:hypothetical protein